MALPNLDLAVEVEQINNYLSKLRDQSPYDDEINDLIDDILQKGGKRIRPLICLLSFEMISNEIRSDLNYAAACALEIIHNASLLIDDIYDKDFFRRKEKSFYLKYSTFAAISLTYSMSSFALSLATKTNVLEVVDELIKVLHTLSTSLFLEKQFRSGERKMSKDEALQLIDRKTSCLFEAASVIGVIMGTSSKEDREKMVKFGKLFGRAFQLRDDLLSLLSTAEELGKSGVMTDISNRIQTYIVLEAIDLADNEEKKILEEYFLNKKDYPPDQIKKILAESEAMQSIKNLIENYTKEAIAIIEKYQDSAPRSKLIEITKALTI
ncbi:MAG: polyprenyl synthetase family protein [Candidatus Heimdallarchaeota archaeon]|nr:polyprenyl synthetase family protein [Candidatus Heimdallarchaeota archaeon]MCK4955205.1 polyprenyl synthetase family protein [Candidatus Heimdallarchaeota archaeon]